MSAEAPEGAAARPGWFRRFRAAVADLVRRLGGIGSLTQDSREDRLRRGTLVLASVLIALLSFVWVGTYLANGYILAATIPASFQVATVAGLVLLARRHRFEVFRRIQFATMLVLPALLQASLGGFRASSGMILWGVFVPLAAVALLGFRRAWGWFAALIGEITLLAVLDPVLSRHPAVLPQNLVTSFFVLNMTGVAVSAFVTLGYFVDQNERSRLALETERERSERLLLNVLPPPIAERLKATSGVIAEQYDDVSVLFADLVGFTAASAVMSADEVVVLLDRIFTAFDDVVDAEGLEKIKTIGDAYMLAGGLPQRRPGHLEAVTRAALAMRSHVLALAALPGQEWLDIRIGIDAGPAVAGVIGRRKFIYDLWGDTVNTASRMESHGIAGQVQVTERVALRIGATFTVRERGLVDVKGKGPMRTYLVES